MNPRLPIKKIWISTDKRGRTCIVSVDIEQTDNKTLYPPSGVKCNFKVRREKTPGEEDYEIVLLIDNHDPYGFHEHPKLPEKHEVRKSIHVWTWQDAWMEFEDRLEGILNET